MQHDDAAEKATRLGEERIEMIIRRESELGAYDLEAVRELLKNAI